MSRVTHAFIVQPSCHTSFLAISFLGSDLKSKGNDGLDLRSLSVGELASSRLAGDALQLHAGSTLGSCSLYLLVLGNSLQVVLTASRRLHVLNADVDPFLDDSVAHFLVELDAESALGDIPHLTSATLVDLVGQTTVDRRVDFDIDQRSKLVGRQVFGQMDGSLLTESLLEQVASA